MKLFQAVSAAALVLVLTFSTARAQSPQGTVETRTHVFHKIADGVYFAVGTGSIHVMSNSMVLVGEDDVLIVDSHVTPAAARALLKAVKKLSRKPVRHLVNSHYHFDHAHGNQVFPAGVDIIGHEYTREKLLGNVLEENTFRSFAAAVPGQIAELKALAAQEDDPKLKAALEEQVRVQEDYRDALPETVPTPPNVTLDKKMTLYQGDREIQLRFFGRAHTGGDVVVFLPKERLVFTGDLIYSALSYMGDGFVDEWPDTLEGLKTLDFDLILPGHGDPVQGKARLSYFQAFLRDLWQRVGDLKKEGLSAQQTSERVDMSDHSANYPEITGPGFDIRAIERMYQRMDN
ncbi:MAG: MBL fold metallo-hydrolase [Candidatus Hydrogenedentes bacterium]|nr:MBL fold metallo-hydrolase [Candidatus Hydrogenedentota bacterium]